VNRNQKLLQGQREYFLRSVACLEEEDGNYRPTEESMTVTQQIAHTAQTVDWFLEGAFRDSGFSHDWEALGKGLAEAKTLTDALAWFNRSYDKVVKVFGELSEEELMMPIKDEMIMTGAPRAAIVFALDDHTAHHRGAISVSARLCGRKPGMPYMDMD
jgi:uncharacterized damage-inducible protein DinB